MAVTDRATDPKVRASGIGASDSPAILGVGFGDSSPLTVYEDKLGLTPPPDAERLMWGKLFEDPIAREYARRADVKVRRIGRTMRHPDHPYILAHPDRYIEREQAILEVKTASDFMRDSWGPDGSDEIPIGYMVQVQHQLLVFRSMRLAIVAVVIGNSEMRTYRILPDPGIQEYIVEAASELWNEHVVPRVPPDPTSVADALRRWPVHTTPPIEATGEAVDWWRHLVWAKWMQKQGEQAEERAKLELMRYMEDHEALITPDGRKLVTWKKNKDSEVIDAKAIEQQEPETAARFRVTRAGPRVFRPNVNVKL